ncbi:RWD domain containing 4A, isoform CRA_b [Rattus norvegicus]|uniref:RWD domain containing 4A, isoform CRA_b n=1 Tax=Rattus norvegicus TaxID=10116 RepID=A6JPL2_RAT|nr:RWD domain containing 4A, isoform CRA_b [Rattus norvegicus]
MVQSVKGLLCKPGDLSSDPQPPTQKTGPAPGTQSWGGGDRRSPGACWPDSLAESLSSWFW